MPTDRPRITITMSDEQLEQVKVFQHGNRMNQTQAILSLIERGFAELEKENSAPEKEKASKPGNPDSEAKKKEQIRVLTDSLKRMGILNGTDDLSENDLAFLRSIFLSVDAYFKKGNESVK